MKKSDLTTLLTAATLFLSLGVINAVAQNTDGSPPPDGPSKDRQEKMMKRADLNGDGVIDETERAAIEAKRRERMSQNPKFLKRADTDGDGKISDTEWAAAKEKMKDARKDHGNRGDKMRRHRKGDDGKPQAKTDSQFRRGYVLGKYDTNKDHHLDASERAAMRTDLDARMRAGMQKHLTRLNQIDADHNGQISDAEWSAAKDSFHQNHPDRPGSRHPGMMPPPPAA